MSNILLEHFDQYVNSVYSEQYKPTYIDEHSLTYIIRNTKLPFIAKYIKNPSERIMLELLDYDKYCFDDFSEKPKSVVRKYILTKGHEMFFDKYVEMFSQDDIFELSKINPYFIKYLDKSFLTHDFLIKCLTKNLYCAEQLENFSNYATYMTFAIVRFFKLKSEYQISRLATLPKITWKKYTYSAEWNSLISTLISVGEIHQVPFQYVDETQLIKGIQNCKHLDEIEKYVRLTLNSRSDLDNKLVYETLFDLNMFSIDHIPHNYQTLQMIHKVLPEINKFNSHILKFLRRVPEVEQKMLELCDIKDIPEYLHNTEICLKAINDNPDNLSLINPDFIDDNVLTAFFKHELMRDIPRAERFEIISQFEENRIIKILRYRPMLISHLTDSQRTYDVLRSLVTFNGYSLQYLTHEEMQYNNGEFVQIALKNEPNAKKYL